MAEHLDVSTHKTTLALRVYFKSCVRVSRLDLKVTSGSYVLKEEHYSDFECVSLFGSPWKLSKYSYSALLHFPLQLATAICPFPSFDVR